MLQGLLFAIAACLVWGLIFIVPSYLDDFSSLEVVLGRYLSYGILSVALLFRKGLTHVRRYSLKIWLVALACSLLSNLIYYLGVVLGVRFASPALSVLIVGLAPIVIAFLGNLQEREVAFLDLVAPCIWLFLGLVLVNATEIDWTFKSKSFQEYLLGISGVVVALLSWSLFAVQYARFLKKNNNEIPAKDWSTIIGVATLFWVLLFSGGVGAIGLKEHVNFSKFFTLTPDTVRYLGGVAVLGVACSWLGCYLWCKATIRLPVSLLGPLLVFETLFGLLYVYLFHQKLPSWIELGGVISMIGGIVMSLSAFRRKRVVSG